MERFLKIIYYICLVGLVCFTVYLTVALAISPKNDAKKRGFIPCTEAFVLHASDCGRGSMGCMATGLWKDMKCNIGVVFGGFGQWISGQQATPWANYIYVPTAAAELDTETPYMGVVAEDVGILEAEHQFLEDRMKELEEAKERKLNLREGVLSDDKNEIAVPQKVKNNKDTKSETEQESFDIEDEAFTDDFSEAEGKNQQDMNAPTSQIDKTKALLKTNTKKSIENKGEIND